MFHLLNLTKTSTNLFVVEATRPSAEGWRAQTRGLHDSWRKQLLVVDDPEIERLIECLCALRGLSETEVLYETLQNELRRYENVSNLVEAGVAFVRALHTRAQGDASQFDNKVFVEGLYDER